MTARQYGYGVVVGILIGVPSCASGGSESVESLVVAYEHADKVASIEDNLRHYSVDEVVEQLLIRLDPTQNPDLTSHGQSRLWKKLATIGREGPLPISDPDRVRALTDAYIGGDSDVRLAVAQNIHRIDPAAYPAIFAIVRDQLATETSDYVAESAMVGLATKGELSGASLQYVRDVYADLHNTPVAMHEHIFYQDGPAAGQPERRGEFLRQSALTAILLSEPDLQAAVDFVVALPDDDRAVVQAMYHASIPGGVLDGAGQAQIAAWLAEYTRRFCLDAGSAHRQDRSIGYYLYLWDEFEGWIEPELCASFLTIQSSCTPANFRGYAAVQHLLQTVCNEP